MFYQLLRLLGCTTFGLAESGSVGWPLASRQEGTNAKVRHEGFKSQSSFANEHGNKKQGK